MKLRLLALVVFLATTQAISQCLITSFTANISACDPADDTYGTTGEVEFTDAPSTGTLTITDCDGVSQTFFPPFVSPTAYSLTGQDADGGPCDITAEFSDAPGCDATLAYTAPFCPCNMDLFTVNIGTCDPFSDTYPVDGTIEFTSPPSTGTLTVTVDNGTGTYDTIINPPFTSPTTFSITGVIPADGAASTITVVFTDDVGCTNVIAYTAPESCFCPAELGTFTETWSGPGSPNPEFLCWGDSFDISANGDFVPPYDAGTPGITYDPGISWLIYSCPPTIGLIPSDDPAEDVALDPCLIGLYSAEDLSDTNDPGILGAFPPGTFTDNIIYFVPITMYSVVDGFYSSTNSAWPCYEMGPYYAVQYIPEYSFSFVEDCNTGEAVVTVNGGLPELDGSLFTASGLDPTSATLDNTTALDGGTITVSGLDGGDVWSFDVTDDNGCPYTADGGPFPPLGDAGSNGTVDLCDTDPAVNLFDYLGDTPIAGGTWAGPSVLGGGSLGTFNPATMTPGVYTYNEGTAPCDSSATVTVTVNPTGDPGTPGVVSFCETDAITNLFTILGGTPDAGGTWDGPSVLGGGSLGAFDPATMTAGVYTYTVGGVPCDGSATVTVTVDLTASADFEFDVYCADEADPLPDFDTDDDGSLDGTAGTFTSTPGLIINAATGEVDLDASTPGVYVITNTITGSGVCPVVTFDAPITINELPDATIGDSESLCEGEVFADVTFTITSGTGPWDIDYTLDGTGLTEAGVGASPYTIPAAEGVYVLTNITDANGCSNTLAGSITKLYYETPVVDAIPDQELCDGESLLIPNFSSSVPGSTFGWVNAGGTDVGFGAGPGVGNIGSFTGLNGTFADVSTSVDVVATGPAPGFCVSEPISFNVTVHPLPDVQFTGPAAGCVPLDVSFENLTTDASNCVWEFGDGSIVTGCGTVNHTFSSEGLFDVTLTVTNSFGCVDSKTYTDWIEVYPRPVAEFTADPFIVNVEDTEVSFENLSTDASSYIWDFGDGSPTSSLISPWHIFPSVPGHYVVTLTAEDAAGICPATAIQTIIVEDVLIFYVPNVFTPDGDEYNEVFQPVFTSGYDPYDFHLMIFNRWGELIFESYDASKGWDGTYGDRGLVKDDVYIWKIVFKETMSDKQHDHYGHVTILK